MSRHLIVAGFHRSGTSLVSRLLHRAGLFLGYDLLGATFSNPHGHFEDAEAVALHDAILKDNGLTWMVDEPFLAAVAPARWDALERFISRREREHEVWGFKDPRACHFLMLWKDRLPDAKVLLVYRHFSDAVYSLGRRQSEELLRNPQGPARIYRRFWEEPDLALRMWLAHNEALLSFQRLYPEDVMAVSLEMVQGGLPLSAAIRRRWGFDLDRTDHSTILDPALGARRPGRQVVFDQRLVPRTLGVWEALEDLGESTLREAGEANVVG